MSKSRIARKDLTVPRLELVAAHMVANLLENFQEALDGYPITGTYAWSDSTGLRIGLRTLASIGSTSSRSNHWGVSSLSTHQEPAFKACGSRFTPQNATWGSGRNNGKSSRAVVDRKADKLSEEGNS